MIRTTIQCPHCGKHTRIDLSFQLSTQKCDRCGVRFSSVDTGSAGSREAVVTEPPSWRRAQIGDWDEERPVVAGAGRMPRWVWAAVGSVLLLAGGTMAFFTTRRTEAARPSPVTVQTLVQAPSAAAGTSSGPGYGALKQLINEASATARRFLAARTVDEILPLLQDRAELEATVRDYYQAGEGAGILPLPEAKLMPIDRQLWIDSLQTMVINYAVEGRPQRAVALRKMEDGRFLIEWPSAVAFNEVPIARFVAERQTTPRLFRVLANVDDYYNRAFSNDHEFLCLRLTDPDVKHVLYGYAPRRSKTGTAIMAAVLPKDRAGLPILVRLKFPQQSTTDNQVEIAEFLGTGWVEGLAHTQPAAAPDAPTPAKKGDSPRDDDRLPASDTPFSPKNEDAAVR